MLGSDLANHNNGDKTSFNYEIQESKFNQLIEQKDNQIKALKKTIKRLNKQLKQKFQSANQQGGKQGGNNTYKTMLERQVKKSGQLRDIIENVAQRVKKFTLLVNQEFSISQNSESMENLVKMLEQANIQGSKYSIGSFSNKDSRSASQQGEELSVEQAIDQFQIILRGFTLKFGENKKMYKQSLQIQKQLQEQVINYKAELKDSKKSKDLLQKLWQTSETQKNQFVNHINSIANQKQIQELKFKTKQEILLHSLKLSYRIKDLEKEKQEYMKSSTKQKQKQMKQYEILWNQVKTMKERSRIRQSVA